MSTLIAVLIFIYVIQFAVLIITIASDIDNDITYKTIKSKKQLLFWCVPVFITVPFFIPKTIFQFIKHIKELE